MFVTVKSLRSILLFSILLIGIFAGLLLSKRTAFADESYQSHSRSHNDNGWKDWAPNEIEISKWDRYFPESWGYREALTTSFEWGSYSQGKMNNLVANERFFTMDHNTSGSLTAINSYSARTGTLNTKFDRDWNGWRFREAELTLLGNVERNYSYRFTSYWSFTGWSSCVSGTIFAHPQVSKKGWFEYNATDWTGESFSAPANTCARSKSNIQDIEDSLYQVDISVDNSNNIVVSGASGFPAAYVEHSQEIYDESTLHTYSDWVQQNVLESLNNLDVETALTTVTFRNPLDETELQSLLGDNYDLNSIKLAYLDTTDSNTTTNRWVFQVGDIQGNDYTNTLTELEAQTIDENAEVLPNLSVQGVLALTVWLPIETVVELNQNEKVFLADPTATYLRLIASDVDGVQQSQQLSEEVGADGAPAFIETDVQDLYDEMTEFQNVVSIPTSISLSNSSVFTKMEYQGIFLLLSLSLTTILMKRIFNPSKQPK